MSMKEGKMSSVYTVNLPIQQFRGVVAYLTSVNTAYRLTHLYAIEGFHDAVRTPYVLRPGRHVGFFLNNKICFNFVSILFEKIKLTVSERTYIIVPMV